MLVRLTTAFALTAALMLVPWLGSAEAKKNKRLFVQRQTTIEFTDVPGPSPDQLSGVVGLGAPPEDPDDAFNTEPLAAVAGMKPARCLANQTVLIHQHVAAGDGGGRVTEPAVVATATTDPSGAWQASYEAASANQLLFDVLTAEIVQRKYVKKTRKGKRKLICAKASATQTVFSY